MGTGVSPARIATGILHCYFASCLSGPIQRCFAPFSCTPASYNVLRFFVSSDASILLTRTVTHCTRLSLTVKQQFNPYFFLRKEVIQPHLPIRLPCYDFTPVTRPAFGGCFQLVSSPTSGISDSHGVTGGVYKTRERIHRSILICDY